MEALRSFAIKAVTSVRLIATDLQTDKGRGDAHVQFCTNLAAALFAIGQKLEQEQESEQRAAEAQRRNATAAGSGQRIPSRQQRTTSAAPKHSAEQRLRKLLSNLEVLCNDPRRYSKPSVPQDALLDRRYPVLAALGGDQPPTVNSATENIRKYGASSKKSPLAYDHERRLMDFLAAFAPLTPSERKLPIPRQSKKATTATSREDYGPILSALHESLNKHGKCDTRAVAVKFRLKTEYDAEYEDVHDPTFSILFHNHPHVESSQNNWQISLVSGSRESQKYQEAALPAGDICKMTREQLHSVIYLQFSLDKEDLYWWQSSLLPKRWVTESIESVSLADVLKPGNPLGYTRDENVGWLLMFLLARSFWQCYDSGWMQQPWTSQNIHFVYERTDDDIDAIYLNEPFILCRLEWAGNKYAGDDSGKEPKSPMAAGATNNTRKIAHIEALGVTMLEIECGFNVRDRLSAQERQQDGTPKVGAERDWARRYIRQKKVRENMADDVEDVIKTCLESSKFSSAGSDTTKARELFLREVLSPLQRLASIHSKGKPPGKRTFSSPHLLRPPHDPTPPDIPDGPAAESLPRTQVARLTPASNGATIQAAQSMNYSPLTSDAWFSELEKVTHVLRASQHSKPIAAKGKQFQYQPVVIAVLDTGIDPTSQYARAILDFKDFIDPKNTQKKDPNGHGTRMVELIFKIFKNAKVCVARTWDGEQVQRDIVASKKAMADAIQHARKSWGAHVISISNGFADDGDEQAQRIRTAIEKAAAAQVLCFAAASNYGNLAPIYFPAKMESYVFCMYSTDPRGNNAGASQSFNPAPKNRDSSFAILGEGIQLSPFDPALEGTSYSTCIAAGLAGHLLEFARHADSVNGSNPIRRDWMLNRFEGMKKVFHYLSTSGEYNCLRPSKFLDFLGEVSDIGEKRSRIRDQISHVLEHG